MTLALLGGGKMGEALLAGLLRDVLSPSEVVVVEKDGARAAYLAATYGVGIGDSAAAAQAATLILAVKPHDLETLLGKLDLTTSQLVISIAAGVSLARMQDALPEGVPVVRCMPNTPALVGQGITAISAGRHATEEHLASAEALLGAVGKVVRVPESQLDAVTALSGSGPAYFFLFVEALIDSGVLLGLPRPLATELVVQTALGSATMLSETGEHPVALREAVTSPGGTTIVGTRELEAHGVRAAVTAAVEAAARRSKELGS
ncbi:MAG TPA: pyrroline-5-carboxylate reductase [Jatrophihabitans sp.]|jgi:pyrroline-5-carboxylate reductase